MDHQLSSFILGIYIGVLALWVWQRIKTRIEEIERSLFDIRHRPSKVD